MEENTNIVTEFCNTLKRALYTKRLHKKEFKEEMYLEQCEEALDIYQAKKSYYPNSPDIISIRHNNDNTINIMFQITPEKYYDLKVS